MAQHGDAPAGNRPCNLHGVNGPKYNRLLKFHRLTEQHIKKTRTGCNHTGLARTRSPKSALQPYAARGRAPHVDIPTSPHATQDKDASASTITISCELSSIWKYATHA